MPPKVRAHSQNGARGTCPGVRLTRAFVAVKGANTPLRESGLSKGVRHGVKRKLSPMVNACVSPYITPSAAISF